MYRLKINVLLNLDERKKRHDFQAQMSVKLHTN